MARVMVALIVLAVVSSAYAQGKPPVTQCSLAVSVGGDIKQEVGKGGEDIHVHGSVTVTDSDPDAFGWGQVSLVFTAIVKEAPADLQVLVGTRNPLTFHL